MTPQQTAALLGLIGDLYVQIGMLNQQIATLQQQLAEATAPEPAPSA